MKKNSLVIFLTGLIFLSAVSSVFAKESGSSANLNALARISKEEIKRAETEKKKMAIRAVLERYQSPMAGSEASFIETCKKYNIDCYLLPSIAGLESTFGRFIWPDSYNPFGWDRGYMMFENWPQSIDTVGKGLRENYINKWGLLSVEQIGPIYSESPTWSKRVSWFMSEFKKEEEKLTLLSAEIPVKL